MKWLLLSLIVSLNAWRLDLLPPVNRKKGLRLDGHSNGVACAIITSELT